MARIESGEIDPVYVVKATDPLLAERLVTALRDRTVPENVRGFNYDVIDAGRSGDASRILGAATTLPMMAERRMVLVRDLSSLGSAELAKLIPYIQDPAPTTVLVGLCRKWDGRAKFYQLAKKLGMRHELSAPRQLAPWLAAEARLQGVRLSTPAQRRLAEVVGPDLARLSLALGQLAVYAGNRAIEVDDVEDLIAETRERTVFELTDAIGAANLDKALFAVASLCEQRQSAIGVLMMLARHVRQLGIVKAAQDRGAHPGEVAKAVGAPPFVVDKLSRQARNYSGAGLARAITVVAEADRQLKGLGGPLKVLGRQLSERIALERLATELIALARASS